MLFADRPGLGPVPLRCGLARGEQPLNYLLGAWRILWAGGPKAIPEKKTRPGAFLAVSFLGLETLLPDVDRSPQCPPGVRWGQKCPLMSLLGMCPR